MSESHRDRFPHRVATLLAAFRRQRPLRGGSLIVTVFGDALAPRGGAIALGSLIELMAPFGLTERLVRTSVARLVHEDWLASRRIGRRSEYRLSARGRERFAEATARIYSGPPGAWHGRWTLVVMPGGTAAERDAVRRQLGWRGFGQIAPGVFAHPTANAAAVRAFLASARLERAALLFETTGAALADADRDRVVRQGWDLRELAMRYRHFIGRYRTVGAALAARAPLAGDAAFVVRTLLIHEYRRIHLRDPLLPRGLLPADWPGLAAYETCRQLYAEVVAPTEAYLDAHATRLAGPLPRADRSMAHRFPPIEG
ncbi:MAG: phenylacetic acid degradation operon negative regulatory protein PaaX [Gammaproteobacteria bacterium]|nr:phenylacetic acid degradation operon negative regulatory protein PaaX [Gammaproteobacteria bacterium]